MAQGTKPLPPGTRNTSINAPAEWLQVVAKEAYRRGISAGELHKQATEAWIAMSNPLVALQLRKLRDSMAKVAMGFCVLLAVGRELCSVHRHDANHVVKVCKVTKVKKAERRSDDEEWLLGGEWA